MKTNFQHVCYIQTILTLLSEFFFSPVLLTIAKESVRQGYPLKYRNKYFRNGHYIPLEVSCDTLNYNFLARRPLFFNHQVKQKLMLDIHHYDNTYR